MALDELASQTEVGHGWRGIEKAAFGYLGKHSRELTASEAALLAALMPISPAPDPWCHPAEALAERNRFLRRMEENGALIPILVLRQV